MRRAGVHIHDITTYTTLPTKNCGRCYEVRCVNACQQFPGCASSCRDGQVAKVMVVDACAADSMAERRFEQRYVRGREGGGDGRDKGLRKKKNEDKECRGCRFHLHTHAPRALICVGQQLQQDATTLACLHVLWIPSGRERAGNWQSSIGKLRAEHAAVFVHAHTVFFVYHLVFTATSHFTQHLLYSTTLSATWFPPLFHIYGMPRPYIVLYIVSTQRTGIHGGDTCCPAPLAIKYAHHFFHSSTLVSRGTRASEPGDHANKPKCSVQPRAHLVQKEGGVGGNVGEGVGEGVKEGVKQEGVGLVKD